jgi:hypothetical protein
LGQKGEFLLSGVLNERDVWWCRLLACRFQIWILFASGEVEQEVWFVRVVEEVWVVVDWSQGCFVVVMVED